MELVFAWGHDRLCCNRGGAVACVGVNVTDDYIETAPDNVMVWCQNCMSDVPDTDLTLAFISELQRRIVNLEKANATLRAVLQENYERTAFLVERVNALSGAPPQVDDLPANALKHSR